MQNLKNVHYLRSKLAGRTSGPLNCSKRHLNYCYDIMGDEPTFLSVAERPSFPEEELKILDYWKRIDAFQTSYKQSIEANRPKYRFYDGPPFATGLPHYGHILAGTIKDIVTRYAHQSGFSVERKFGWDCHGLPVEYEIDKILDVTSRKDIQEKIGVANYNEKCRSIVQRYAKEWRSTIERLGRWIDFDNDYKTLDLKFMESVWWVFKQLFDKGLVYRAFKVMPYSNACTTPLSNFEANQNYKDVNDPSIVVTFPSLDDDTLEFIAWTTTPWTLPSNCAICVNPELNYVRIRKLGYERDWVILENRIEWFAGQTKLEIGKDLIINNHKFPGKELIGQRYLPLFDFFMNDENLKSKAFKIISDNYVNDDTGTGCVHQAPAFGEDDHRVCIEHGVVSKEGPLPCPIDADGKFVEPVTTYKGLYIKDADKRIKIDLKERKRLLINSDFVHSYPHCWRSDTPLIYKAVPSWFIRVEKLKDELVLNNQKTYWVPSAVKEKRFHNWLKDARDWCVSRNRYWGTPLPLWTSSDFQQIVCIGSLEELQKYLLNNHEPIVDIHRHFIDHIELPDPRGPEYPPLRRVDEVFDCWFESGSMPYAQQHYPFEDADQFENAFPADFIAEGLDQTRGWFYTLMVISTALFNKPPFKNLIVNGLVLAADGKKMSKRLRNYPDPLEVVNISGADALRLYLVNSPVVRAESLRFRESGVMDTVKDLLLPWYHAYRFFTQQVTRLESQKDERFKFSDTAVKFSDNLMDKWIYASTQRLILFVKEEMKAYRLYTVIPALVNFIEQLTNWYVRLNRDRMRGQFGHEETYISLCVLFDILFTIVKLMAPFTPFMSELLYQNLKRGLPEKRENDSVHYLMMPTPDEAFINVMIEARIKAMQNVVITGRMLRERKKVSLKTPLKEMTLIVSSKEVAANLEPVINYIKDELNVLECTISTDTSLVQLTAMPNFRTLGSRVGKAMGTIANAIKCLDGESIQAFEKSGEIQIEGYALSKDDLTIKRTCAASHSNPDIAIDACEDVVVLLNFVKEPHLQQVALAREITNRIQKLKKQLGLRLEDTIIISIDAKGPLLFEAIEKQKSVCLKGLKRDSIGLHSLENPLELSADQKILHYEEFEIGEEDLGVAIITDKSFDIAKSH